MATTRVVILSTHSLFVEGVAKRLKQHLPEEHVQVVDARQADALEQVMAARPTSVILDATDVEATSNCPLSKMLNALPSLKIIRLDPHTDKIQVVVSEQRVVEQVSDLIEVIQASGADRKEEGEETKSGRP
jgi:DNA-binding NarL/FixJ family response regulator